MTMPPASTLLVAITLGANTLLCQSAPIAASPPWSLRDVHGVVAGPDGPVGIGADYKAHFAAAGVTFTPALGDAAPHNLPVQWSLLDIRRGGAVVHEAAATVVPEAVGDAVQFARGAVTERYDVLANGLEQSFVFKAPLGERGDLVVRGRITCELPAVTGDDGTHSWLQPGVGGVHIGAVTGIDAAGRRVRGSQRMQGDVLELVLPAAFVDGASYPLTLDPLYGASVLFSGNQDAIECDVAASDLGYGNEFLVAWTRRYSSADTDVYGQAGLTVAGNAIPHLGLLAFDATTALARRPRVGSGNLSNHLVFWESSTSLLAPRMLMYSFTLLQYGPGPLVSLWAFPGTAVDVLADGPGGFEAGAGMVLYRGQNGIQMRQMGLLSFGQAVTIASGSDFHGLAISRHADSNGSFLVAYGVPGPLSTDIVVHQMTTGMMLVGSLTLGSSLLDDAFPAIDGHMVAWERTESTFGNAKRDVVCATLSVTATGPQLLAGPTTLAGASGVDEYAPTIAFAALRHAIAYVRTVGVLDTDVEAWLVNDDCTTCNSQMVLQGVSGAFSREGAPRISGIAPWITQPAHLTPMMLVFSEASITPPFTSQVVAQAILPIAQAPTPADVGGQCGLGGTIGTTSVASVGNSVFALELTNGAPNALHLLSLGTPTPGLACGPCVLTNPTSLTFAGGGGTATSTFPIPCSPSLVNLQFEAQWLSLTAGNSPCPLVADLSASSRLLITVGN